MFPDNSLLLILLFAAPAIRSITQRSLCWGRGLRGEEEKRHSLQSVSQSVGLLLDGGGANYSNEIGSLIA